MSAIVQRNSFGIFNVVNVNAELPPTYTGTIVGYVKYKNVYHQYLRSMFLSFVLCVLCSTVFYHSLPDLTFKITIAISFCFLDIMIAYETYVLRFVLRLKISNVHVTRYIFNTSPADVQATHQFFIILF